MLTRPDWQRGLQQDLPPNVDLQHPQHPQHPRQQRHRDDRQPRHLQAHVHAPRHSAGDGGARDGWADPLRALDEQAHHIVRSVDRALAAAAAHRQSNFRALLALLQRTFGEAVQLHEYGSTRTRLALPDSDLDCVMVVPGGGGEPGGGSGFGHDRETMVALLEEVSWRLRAEPWVSSLVYVKTAAMPVIKLIGVGGVPVDLTCMGAHHQGLRTLHLVTGLLGERPLLRPLALLLKQFLRGHGLADTQTGGLSSYATVLLAASFLAQLRHTLEWRPPSTGSALVGLLQTLAEAELDRVVFSPTLGCLPRTPATSPDVLVVEDPFLACGNAAQGMYRVSQLRTLARDAHQALVDGTPLHLVLQPHHPGAQAWWLRPRVDTATNTHASSPGGKQHRHRRHRQHHQNHVQAKMTVPLPLKSGLSRQRVQAQQ